MTNLPNPDQSNQTFEAQVESFTLGLVSAISALAPLALILVILGIAGANAMIEYAYQKEIFPDFAVFPAILIAGLRFGAGMGSIVLIKKSRFIPGIFFMLISLGLTIYSWWHVPIIAEMIAPTVPAQASFTIALILWGGLFGEAMIATYQFSMGNDRAGLPPFQSWFKSSKNGKEATVPAQN